MLAPAAPVTKAVDVAVPPPPAALFDALFDAMAAMHAIHAMSAPQAMQAPQEIHAMSAPRANSLGPASDPDPMAFTEAISEEGSLPPLAISDMATPTDPRVRSMTESMFFWEGEEDPVLLQKMEPAVRARRARFQKFAKGAIGACAGVCVIALVCSLVSSLGKNAQLTTSTAAERVTSVRIAHAASTTVESFDPLSVGRARHVAKTAGHARTAARR